MAQKCEINGCEREAVHTGVVFQAVRNIDAEKPLRLCEEHAKKLPRCPETDVDAAKKWLSDPAN